jgi:hypothetical protein
MTSDHILTKDSLIQKVKDLLNNLQDGDISPSAYDTAWVARIPDRNDPKKPMFPECLQWVKDHQLADGSWGTEEIEYFHDRVICTLSCIVALKTWDTSDEQVSKGEEYLSKNLENLSQDAYETCGFELVFPSLINQAKKLGLRLPYLSSIIEKYILMRAKKLEKIPWETIYKYKSTISYSIEFLEGEENIDYDKLIIHREEDGSYGCSPASTAFILMHKEDDKAVEYLTRTLKLEDGSLPNVYTPDVFEKSWLIDNIIDLGLEDVFKKEVAPHVKELDRIWKYRGEAGFTFSRWFPTSDIDGTSVGLRVLNHFGYKKSPEIFKKFRDDNGFFGFQGEKEANASYLANLIRTLEEYEDFPEKQNYLAEAIQKLESYSEIGYKDKWHVSPYYTVSRMVFQNYHNHIAKNIEWIVNTQNNDGSWGFKNDGTMEETAMALIVLLKQPDEVIQGNARTIERGVKYLKENINLKGPSALWIGKCVYSMRSTDRVMILNIIIFYQIKYKLK